MMSDTCFMHFRKSKKQELRVILSVSPSVFFPHLKRIFKQPGGGSVSWIKGSDYKVWPLSKPVQNEENEVKPLLKPKAVKNRLLKFKQLQQNGNLLMSDPLKSKVSNLKSNSDKM